MSAIISDMGGSVDVFALCSFSGTRQAAYFDLFNFLRERKISRLVRKQRFKAAVT